MYILINKDYFKKYKKEKLYGIYLYYIYTERARSGIKLITNNYEDAITYFYRKDKNDNDTYFSHELHKVPLNVKLDEEKLGLNSKFRIKFKEKRGVNPLFLFYISI